MPNQRAADNAQTSISLPRVLLAFARKKAQDTGLDNVSAYIRVLIKNDQMEQGRDLKIRGIKRNKVRLLGYAFLFFYGQYATSCLALA